MGKYSTVMHLIGQIQYSFEENLFKECYVNRMVDIRMVGKSGRYKQWIQGPRTSGDPGHKGSWQPNVYQF